VSTRPKIDLFGSVKTDQVLATLTGDRSSNPNSFKSQQEAIEEKAALEAKVQALTAELAQKQGFVTLPFNQISRNPLNPRIIFPQAELQSFAEILKEQGQLEPGVLVELSEEIRSQITEYADRGLFLLNQPLVNLHLPYLLFNGERRWRAGSLAGLSGFKAVILPGTIAQDLLDMQSKMAATTIFQKKLHPLEMAQFLITQINYHYPYIAEHIDDAAVVYPRVLNSLIVRLQREDKRTGSKRVAQMNSLATGKREDQQQWLNDLDDEMERAIVDVLYRHQQKPSTINRHVFPLLKLPEDLKQAVYKAGLEVEKIEELKRLNAKNLDISETTAIALRTGIIQEATEAHWDKTAIAHRVATVIAEHQPSAVIKPTKLPPTFSSLEKVNVAELSKLEAHDLRRCQQILEQRLQEIQSLLKEVS
jgi:ParB family chromosome partitioning protein